MADRMNRPTVIIAKVPVKVAHQLGAIAVATGDTVSGLILEAVTRLIDEHRLRYDQYCLAFGEGNGFPSKQEEPEEQDEDA